MIAPTALLVLGALVKSASAAITSTFTTPAAAPTDTSPFYVGASNGSLPHAPVVPGAAFDRFIQIWMENTDFATASSSPVFQSLAAQGILLNAYYGVTHPSEPNYISCVGGDFFGLGSDNLELIPNNVSTVVDLLDQKNIGWAEYQENMPTDGYTGFNYTNAADNYTYYVRKHNPLIIYDSVSGNATRAARIRNFNDFAYDLGNNTLPQWIFVTPNIKNDGHDTNVTWESAWLSYWLVPLLQDPQFNTPRTLILLTFDENENYTINNQVYSLLLGGAIPENLKNTTDDTFYTHYSSISTVENNWNLENLGRQDTNKTVSNVFKFVAAATGYENNNLTATSTLPLLNITGTIPGALNPDLYVPYLAPNISGVGGGNGSTFVASGTNLSLNASAAPPPVNLTSASNTTTTTTTSGATGGFGLGNVLMAAVGGVLVAAALL